MLDGMENVREARGRSQDVAVACSQYRRELTRGHAEAIYKG
jgi:hypothetical protein